MANRTITAHAFARCIGVNGNADEMQSVYNATGIRKFRMSVSSSNAATVQSIGSNNTIPDLGACMFVNAYQNKEQPAWSTGQQQAWLTSCAAYLDYIEGPNELNNRNVGGGSYAPADSTQTLAPWGQLLYVSWMQEIYNFLHNSGTFASGSFITGKKTGIILGSLAGGQNYVGNTSPWNDANPWATVGTTAQQYGDFGPSHAYPIQAPCNANVPQGGGVLDNYNKGKILTPTKPIISTEAGHNTAVGATSDYLYETVHAKVLLCTWMDYIALGAPSFFIFNAHDSTAYANITSSNSDQGFYGILHQDGTTKVIARAIKTMLTLVGETAPSFTPSSYPAITVNGLTDSPQSLTPTIVVAKSDGTYWVIIWNEPATATFDPTHNNQTGTDVSPPADYITVSFGGTYDYAVYDPLKPLIYYNANGDKTQSQASGFGVDGLSPVATGGQQSGISGTTLNMRGYPILIKLSNGTGTTNAFSPATHGMVIGSDGKLMKVNGKLCST